MTVRVRIAPAPSGTLHIGNARTALYNWLFARGRDGTFVLRIEDTDRQRVRDEFIDSAMAELRWLGLEWDEGPGAGGDYGPYRQSERLGVYAEAVEKLTASGDAYRCYCTPGELDERRKKAMAEKRRPGYDGRCYRLSDAERQAFEAEGRRWVMRFHVPEEGETSFEDAITGTVTWQHAEIDDFAIYRQDGTPIYNFGAAVDDAFMQISHVIRGLDIQSSTPRQIMVLRALGLPVPVYAHIPLVMGEGGKKLSKRYGGGSVQWYRDHGFLPDAVVNWMVLLGTGYGDETILSRDEMIAGFDLSKVNASAAAFDLEKLDWMNGEYIRMMAGPAFDDAVRPWLASQGLISAPVSAEEAARLTALAPLAKTRIKRLEESVRYMRPVLNGLDMDPAAFEKVMRQEHVVDQLARSVEKLEALGQWDRDAIEAALREIQTAMGLKPKTAFAPFYVSVTGSTVSLPIFDVMALVGRDECLRRIKEALRALTG